MPIRTQIPLAISEKKIQNEPVAAFKRNKNLKELTGSNKIENKIVKKIKKAL